MQGQTVRLEVTVPANAAAIVIMPCAAAKQVRESQAPLAKASGIKNIVSEAGTVRCTVGSGVYSFTFPRPV